MNKEIFNVLEKTDLITNFSKWQFDTETTYMFLPIIPDNSLQIFEILRNGEVTNNHFKLDFIKEKLVITFINSNQSYYLAFSEDGRSEFYLTGSDPIQSKVVKRLIAKG